MHELSKGNNIIIYLGVCEAIATKMSYDHYKVYPSHRVVLFL